MNKACNDNEQVMVVPASLISSLFPGQISSFIPCANTINAALLAQHHFLDRPKAEVDPSYRQLIPYVMVTCDSYVLVARRLREGTERRLHNRLTLALGGHVSSCDAIADQNPIINALFRELGEEVKIDSPFSLSFKGIINDLMDPVGAVHLGLFYVARLKKPAITLLETKKLSVEWYLPSDIKTQFNSLESWSRIIYEYFFSPSASQAEKLLRMEAGHQCDTNL